MDTVIEVFGLSGEKGSTEMNSVVALVGIKY